MYKFNLTVGLFDKATERQEVETCAVKKIIDNILIEDFGLYAFTMWECSGVYRMQSTGAIVHEPSLRLEIATDEDETETMRQVCESLKVALNQESIMFERCAAAIDFI